jgi:hypothetical protein
MLGRSTLGLGLGVWLVVGVTGMRAEGRAGATLNDVRKAWKERQDRVRSARFTWQDLQTDAKGCFSWMVSGARARRLAEERKQLGMPEPRWLGAVPPWDTTHTVIHAVCFDGEKLRYSIRGNHAMNPHTLEYGRWYYVSVFDGKVAKLASPEGTVLTPWPTIIIKAKPQPIDAQVPHLRPVLMTFRALFPRLRSYDIDRLTFTGRQAVIRGAKCLELEQKEAINQVTRLWVDPGRAFVIVRYLTLSGEHVTQKIDVRFRKDAVTGWTLEGWDVDTLNSDGTLKQSSRASVTESEINPIVPEREFDIEEVHGARVRDERSDLDYVVKEGRKRKMLPEDFGATYEQLMNSESGEALGKRKQASWTWRVGLLCGLTAFLGVVLICRWRFRRRAVLP